MTSNGLTVQRDIFDGHVTLHLRPYETLKSLAVLRQFQTSSIPMDDNNFATALRILESDIVDIDFHESGKEFVVWKALRRYWQNRKPNDMEHNYDLFLSLPANGDVFYVTNEIILAYNETRNNDLMLAPAILSEIPKTEEDKKKEAKPSKS